MSAIALTQDVHYNSMPGTDFSKFHTYKWVAIPGAKQLNQIQEAELKQAVDTQLAAKGFTQTTTDSADMYVGSQVSVDKEKEWNAYVWAAAGAGAAAWRLPPAVQLQSAVLPSISTILRRNSRFSIR